MVLVKSMSILVTLLLSVFRLTQDDPARQARELVEKLGSDRVEDREEAVRRLKQLGYPSIPFLEDAIQSHDPEVSERAARVLRVLKIRQLLTPRLVKVFPELEERLASGTDRTWMQVLVEARDGEKSAKVSWSSEDLAPFIGPALRASVGHEEQDIVCRLVVAKQIRSAIPQLVEIYLHEVSFGGPSIQALVRLQAREAIPQLLTVLPDPSPMLRRKAAYLLGRLRAKEVVSKLVRMLGDADPDAGETAAWALCELKATEGIPGIAAFLESNRPRLRCTAVLVLPRLGAKSEVPGIARLLDDFDFQVRSHAALALGELGAREMIPRILPLLKDPDEQVRWFSSSALGKLGDPATIPDLLRLLADPQPRVRWAATAALGEMGAREAIPKIRSRLEDESGEVQGGALDALVKLRAAEETVFIMPLLENESPGVRAGAVHALWKLGDWKAAPGIALRLKDSDPKVAGAAAEWFCRMGSRRGVPAMLEQGQPLWPLNLIRRPEDWKRLDQTDPGGALEVKPKELLGLLAHRHGLVLDWSEKLLDTDPPWVTRWTFNPQRSEGGTLETFMAIAGDCGELVLERDRIRVLPRDEALRFWRDWWKSEDEKK